MKRKVQVVLLEKKHNGIRLIQFRLTPKRGGFWQNITGSVDAGETNAEAARRELYEESGLNLGPLIDLNHHFSFIDRFGEQVEEHVFLGLIEGPYYLRLSDEHDNYRTISLSHIRPDNYGHLSSYEAFLKAKLKAN